MLVPSDSLRAFLERASKLYHSQLDEAVSGYLTERGLNEETVAKFHTRLLPLTLPFVLYGIFRYLYLLYRRDLGGNPSDLLVTDRALLFDALLWMLATLAIIYGSRWAG